MLGLWPGLKSLLIWICSYFFFHFFLFFYPYCITFPLAKRTERGESGVIAVAQWIHSGYNESDEFGIPSPFSLPFMMQCANLDLLSCRSSSCDVQMSDSAVLTPLEQPTIKQPQQLLSLKLNISGTHLCLPFLMSGRFYWALEDEKYFFLEKKI